MSRRLIGLLLLSLFAGLMAVVIVVEGNSIDRDLADLLTSHRTTLLTRMIVGFDFFGSYLGIGIGLALFGLWWWRHDPELVWRVVFGTVLVAFLVSVLKMFVARARPVDIFSYAQGYAFPSSHAAVSAYFFGWLWVLAGKGERRWWRYVVRIWLPVLILVIGAGRVYLGAHWPSDVVAGVLLGLGLMVMASLSIGSDRRAPGGKNQRGHGQGQDEDEKDTA